MKSLINRALFGRNSRVSLILAITALLAIGLACGGGNNAADEKQAGPEFFGAWTAKDGSFITIRADGSADYKIGGTSVSGGSAKVSEKEKTLRIALLGMGSPMKIDKAPQNGEMTIDGIIFKKDGGSDSKSDSKPDQKSDSKSDISKPDIPSNDRLQTLIKTTFMDFSDAVQLGDFTDFNRTVAKVWQEDSSADEMKTAFKSFVDNKENYNFKKAVSPLDATFSPAPSIEKVSDLDALVLKGYYPTKPQRANFELKYTKEDGNWKLIGINIKTTNE